MATVVRRRRHRDDGARRRGRELARLHRAGSRPSRASAGWCAKGSPCASCGEGTRGRDRTPRPHRRARGRPRCRSSRGRASDRRGRRPDARRSHAPAHAADHGGRAADRDRLPDRARPAARAAAGPALPWSRLGRGRAAHADRLARARLGAAARRPDRRLHDAGVADLGAGTTQCTPRCTRPCSVRRCCSGGRCSAPTRSGALPRWPRSGYLLAAMPASDVVGVWLVASADVHYPATVTTGLGDQRAGRRDHAGRLVRAGGGGSSMRVAVGEARRASRRDLGAARREQAAARRRGGRGRLPAGRRPRAPRRARRGPRAGRRPAERRGAELASPPADGRSSSLAAAPATDTRRTASTASRRRCTASGRLPPTST